MTVSLEAFHSPLFLVLPPVAGRLISAGKVGHLAERKKFKKKGPNGLLSLLSHSVNSPGWLVVTTLNDGSKILFDLPIQ